VHAKRASGAQHQEVEIDAITKGFEESFFGLTQKHLKFKVHGGSHAENIALQNIQARARMGLAYFLAQTLRWSRDEPGTLLVLGSSNVRSHALATR
jgi:NAD+ synthase (glutamine-hydrolysing)